MKTHMRMRTLLLTLGLALATVLLTGCYGVYSYGGAYVEPAGVVLVSPGPAVFVAPPPHHHHYHHHHGHHHGRHW